MSSPPSNPVEFEKNNSPGTDPENETQKSILTKDSSETPAHPSTSEDSAGQKEESMSVDGNKMSVDDDKDLELRYEGDDEDILDEDALLASDMELENNEVKLPEEGTSDLQNPSEIIKDTASIDKVSVPTDLQDNFVEVKKESENQNDKPLVKSQDPSSTEEFETETKMEIDLNVSDSQNLSTFSQKSSFEPLKEHGLNKPDTMLEIPTQEIIEFSDEDDDDLGCNTLTLSPDVEDVNLSQKNDDFEISKQNIDSTHSSAKCSTVIDTNVLADSKVNIEVLDPKPNSDSSQTIIANVENSEDVNMEVSDASPNDPTTNALIYEAEIAADIITKEMQGLEDNTAFMNEDDVIQHVNKEIQELSCPFKSNISNPSDKKIMSQTMQEESVLLEENSDVIEISDDNECNECENSVAAPKLNTNDEVQKLNNALLEEDILNDTQEIDKLLLPKKTVAKDCDNLDTNSVKSNTIISENTKVLENMNELDIAKYSTKIDADLTKIVAMETDEVAITTETISTDLSLVRDTSSPKTKLSTENVENLTPKSKSEGCTSERTMFDVNTSSKLDSHTASKLSTLPVDDQTEPKMADTLLSTNLEIDLKINLTSKSTEVIKTAASESIETDKPHPSKASNENKLSMIEDPASSKTCTVISDISEENISKSIDVADLLSESNLKLTLEDIPEKQAIKIPEPVDESMEIDDIQQSSDVLEPKICEGGELQPSNIEPKISETIKRQSSEETKTFVSRFSSSLEQKISDIIEIEQEPNLSSVEPKISENNEPQPELTASEPLSSNIETKTKSQLLVGSLPLVELNPLIEQQLDNKMLLDQKTSKILEPQLKLSNDEPKVSEIIEQKLSTSSIELKTSEIVELQPSVEPKTLELHLPTSLEQNLPKGINVEPNKKFASEIIEPPTLTSKIDEEKDEPSRSTINIEVPTSNTAEPQPFNIEPTTSIIVESPPSIEHHTLEVQLSTTLKPKISNVIEPQPNLSNLESKVLENIEPSTSKSVMEVESIASKINIDAPTSKAIEALPSTSKCDAEPLTSKPNSPKNIEAFDSLIQDSSDDVPETTDSLGLLAESSRVVEDDEEHDDDEYVEDEEDFEPDDGIFFLQVIFTRCLSTSITKVGALKTLDSIPYFVACELP